MNIFRKLFCISRGRRIRNERRRLFRTLHSAFAAIRIVAVLLVAGIVQADDLCATPEERAKIMSFYAENPGMLPTIAARRLELSEAVVVSALPADQAVSAPGSAFADVWAAMGAWEQATFLIIKDGNVFEVLSSVGVGAPSERSRYFNIAYTQPLRGHLRPDTYAAIYAIDLPASGDDAPPRGVLIYGDDGSLVFGAYISGDAMRPAADELAKFEIVKTLVASRPAVCPAGS